MHALRRFASWLCLALALVLFAGCSRSPGQPAAATGEKPRNEADLARITLSRDDAKALGVVSEPIKVLKVQERLKLTGWIIPKPGNEVSITAPVAGHVRLPADAKSLPVPGTSVEQDAVLFNLDPVLSPVEQVQLAALKLGVESELVKAEESLRVAQNELKRVQELYAKKLRGQQELEQAQAQVKFADADLKSAKEKLKLFGDAAAGKQGGFLKSIPITAPRGGTVLMVHVSAGQYVQAAAPLATIADLSELWVRVLVPEPDLARIAGGPARITLGTPGSGLKPAELEVEFVTRVRQVDPAGHTVDLLYKVSKPPDVLCKDQTVTVWLPAGRQREEIVVPYSALIFDTSGGAWVYVDKSPASDASNHVYERRRVELGPEAPEGQVIRHGCVSGDSVVTAKAAILFSREFYKPPATSGAKEVEDDD